MNSAPCPCHDFRPSLIRDTGIYAFGIADAAPVDEQAHRIYNRWIEQRRHGSMLYMERYSDIRLDPRLLLPDTASVICCAIPYYSPQSAMSQGIAAYALGTDYHEVVRRILNGVATRITDTYGGATRVCVDTAPIRERYWAVRSGLGTIGINNQLIIPGAGTYFFLGEILTTVHFTPTPPLRQNLCTACMRCVRACPTGALKSDGSCDTSRCLSYLTIEHRGDLPSDTDLHGHLYGCDECARACPLNSTPPATDIEELKPRPEVLSLTPADVLDMDQTRFSTIFSHSAIKRTKLAGLRRNAELLPTKQKKD